MVRTSYFGYYDRIHYKYYCYMSVEEYLTKIKGYKGKKTYSEDELEFVTEEDRQKFRNGEEFLLFDTKEEIIEFKKNLKECEEALKRVELEQEMIPDEYQKMVDEKWNESIKLAEEGKEDDGRFRYVERECSNCGSVQLGSYYDICSNCSYLGEKVNWEVEKEVERKKRRKERKIREYYKVRELRGYYKYALNGICPKCKSNVSAQTLSCPYCSMEFKEFYQQNLNKMKKEEKDAILDYNDKLETEINLNEKYKNPTIRLRVVDVEKDKIVYEKSKTIAGTTDIAYLNDVKEMIKEFQNSSNYIMPKKKLFHKTIKYDYWTKIDLIGESSQEALKIERTKFEEFLCKHTNPPSGFPWINLRLVEQKKWKKEQLMCKNDL